MCQGVESFKDIAFVPSMSAQWSSYFELDTPLFLSSIIQPIIYQQLSLFVLYHLLVCQCVGGRGMTYSVSQMPLRIHEKH